MARSRRAGAQAGHTPAAFFLHFGPEHHEGQAAIDRRLQFFRHTGMDFVKIQYKQGMSQAPIASPARVNRPRLAIDAALQSPPHHSTLSPI